MNRAQAAKLAKIVDELEADMRRMEARLYRVRCELEKVCGPVGYHPTEYCHVCDGCGWIEGGTAIKTTCKACNGTGAVMRALEGE